MPIALPRLFLALLCYEVRRKAASWWCQYSTFGYMQLTGNRRISDRWRQIMNRSQIIKQLRCQPIQEIFPGNMRFPVKPVAYMVRLAYCKENLCAHEGKVAVLYPASD